MAQDAVTNRVILVTGPSGAGRTTAIRALEDLGYEAIDNLPLSFLPRLLDGPAPDKPLALGIDVRNRDFSAFGLIEAIDREGGDNPVGIQVLYLDCSTDVLLRRFSETRRRHPLARAENAEAGIEREMDLLVPIKARADFLIDSSDLTPHSMDAAKGRKLVSDTEKCLKVLPQVPLTYLWHHNHPPLCFSCLQARSVSICRNGMY